MKKIAVSKFTLFAIINWIMICECIYIFAPGQKDPIDTPMPWMYLLALSIVLIQYPFLQKMNTWKVKLLIFYASMVLFFFIFGVGIYWNESVGSHLAGTWDARLDGAIRMVFFGHIFGGWLFPVVVFINWLLRKRFFDHKIMDNNS